MSFSVLGIQFNSFKGLGRFSTRNKNQSWVQNTENHAQCLLLTPVNVLFLIGLKGVLIYSSANLLPNPVMSLSNLTNCGLLASVTVGVVARTICAGQTEKVERVMERGEICLVCVTSDQD